MADIIFTESDEVTIADAAGTSKLIVSAAGAAKVDGSAVTQPISAVSLPLPTGAATSALQTTGNTSVASIDTKIATLGQKTMAGSSPVVIASNQSAVPTVLSGTTATITRVATSTTSTQLLAANTNRKSAVIATESGTNFLAYAATASATSYTYPLGIGVAQLVTGYTGAISLIRSAGSGSVQVTEIV